MVTTDSKKLNGSANTFRLEAADIILVHTKKSLWGWIIRRGTHCYWNHALIVYSPGNLKNCNNDALVVDAKTGGTIEMDHLRKYITKKDKYDVAVKRLEVNWFQDKTKSCELAVRDLVCNIAAKEVAVTFNSKLAEITNQTIRQVTIIIRFLKQKIFGKKKAPRLPWNIHPIQMKAFTCGGFIQWCYYRGVSQLIKEHRLDKPKQKDVVFNPRARKKITPYELLTTTPADLAKCRDLSWKYIIKSGVIKNISGENEAFLYTRAL
jgi:hypothetical protein